MEISKKANSSIYHYENYIQIKELKCVLQLDFNNNELTPWTKKKRHSMRLKQNEA